MDRAERERRRARRTERACRLNEVLSELDSDNDLHRALAVRSLCLCQADWPRTIWDHVLAACEDPSPRVRIEALHVIEDAPRPPEARVMRALRHARSDPDPRVAEAAVRNLNSRRNRDRWARDGRISSPEDREHRKRLQAQFCDEDDP